MTGYERNLVLVHTEGLQARSDFASIASKVAERAPEIEVFIVNNSIPNSVSRRRAAERPSLVFSPPALRQFRPSRGKIYAGCNYTKLEQVRRLLAAGRNVPEAVAITPTTKLDPHTWGPLTIVKPDDGKQGLGVVLQLTENVRWVDPLSWPRDDPRYGQLLLAQKFIDTGPYSVSYRVMTVFGRPTYSSMTRQKNARGFDVDTFAEEQLTVPIASNTGDRMVSHNFDADILAFGADIAGAFPELPVLGVDVIRDVGSNALYTLEVNPSGRVWHISSDYGMKVQRDFGLDYMNQLGALDVIADALIDVTRREAE